MLPLFFVPGGESGKADFWDCKRFVKFAFFVAKRYEIHYNGNDQFIWRKFTVLLRSLLSGDLREFLITLCLVLPAVVICLTIHECAHGLMARALGDRTAERAGRLTLDPLAHIDPVGFLCMLLLGFGWARPVPVNVSGFRIKNRKAGMALVALAGPLSNLILAFLSYIIALLLTYKVQSDITFVQTLSLFFTYIGSLSVGLGVFNLIPVHPLDGSRVLDAFLPYRIQAKLERYHAIILLAIVVIIYFGLFDIVISGVNNWVVELAIRVVRPLL